MVVVCCGSVWLWFVVAQCGCGLLWLSVVVVCCGLVWLWFVVAQCGCGLLFKFKFK